MYKILGWLNVFILLIIIMPCMLIFYNKLLKNISLKLLFVIMFLKKFHKPLGIILLFMPLIHGYMALGEISFHTGSILYVCILLSIIHGAIYSQFRKRFHFVLHKLLAALSFVLFFLHLFYPWALSIFK